MYQNNLIHIMAEKGKKKIKVSVQSQYNRVLIKDNLTNIYIYLYHFTKTLLLEKSKG